MDLSGHTYVKKKQNSLDYVCPESPTASRIPLGIALLYYDIFKLKGKENLISRVLVLALHRDVHNVTKQN